MVIYSNPFVHTVYYFRKVFSPSASKELEGFKSLFLQEQGFGDKVKHKDFAFNENVHCASVANGIFMRMNACSLIKLRNACLYPTKSAPKKVAQYLGCVFFSPIAAVIDLVVNTALLVFKLVAYPFLFIAVRTDKLSKDCMYKNMSLHFDAFGESILNAAGALFESVVCSVKGPKKAIVADWCYPIIRYEGPDVPLLINQNFPAPFNELASSEVFAKMSKQYQVWFQNGQEERILDPQRVRYLRNHCGWNNISNAQLKDKKFRNAEFKDTKFAFRFNAYRQEFTVIVDGKNTYTERHGNLAFHHTDKFIQRLVLPV